MGHDTKLRICFVAHLAYGAMAGGRNGHIGGVERQTSLMAKWLAARGHKVSVLTWDEGQEDGLEIDGVQIFKMCRSHAGLPGLRFLRPRWTSLNAAMQRADADIYYHNCAECVTGQVAFWCRRHGRRFVFSAAADSHCEARLPYMHSFRDRLLYRYGVGHADRVIVQTRKQQDMLRSSFGRDSAVLPMPCPGPFEDDYAYREPLGDGPPRVVWIGRIYELKRLDRLLDVAEVCPEVSFDVLGPPADTEYARSVCLRARSLTNVVLHGPVSRGRISEFYRRAKVLCCTSDSEGFPNTFLEAWSHGLPVVSTFDPDNVIAERGVGVVATGVSGLVNGIRRLVRSQECWHEASQAARQYYKENHRVEVTMPQFESIFLSLLHDTTL